MTNVLFTEILSLTMLFYNRQGERILCVLVDFGKSNYVNKVSLIRRGKKY